MVRPRQNSINPATGEDPSPITKRMDNPGTPRPAHYPGPHPGGAPQLGTSPMPMAPLPMPPAAPSDRVLLPAQSERPPRPPPGRAAIPSWVFLYVFAAVLLSLAGGLVLWLESKLVGHF